MKRFITTCLGLGSLAAIGACTDLSEKLVSNLSNQYIQTQNGLTAGTNAIYQQLRGYYGREQEMALSDMGTDIFTNGDQVSSGAQAWFYLNDYTSGLNATDGRIQELWNPMYVLIGRANVVLDVGPNTPTGGDLTAAVKNSRLGEAHFLRALAYFELAQQYGDVTLIQHATGNVSTEATRTPAADVYKAIIADLDSAKALLPETQADWGRVRKGAAQHLLAKVYLTRGYKSYGEGNTDFQKALANADSVINSGRFTLSPVYADLFCGTHTTDQNAPDPNRQGFCNVLNWNRQNAETIFSVQYSYNPQQYAPCGQANITDCDNYLHLVYLSRYDNDNNIGVGLPRDLNNGRPFRRIRATPFLFSLYDQTRWVGTPGQSDILDTRFDGTFQTLWFASTSGGRNGSTTCAPLPQGCTSGAVVSAGDTALWMPGYQVDTNYRKTKKFSIYVPCANQAANPPVQCGRDNKLARVYGWEVGPSMKKQQDNGRTGGVADQAGGKDVILMRLGETYLLAAEAAFKLGQNQTAADRINVLRARAASTAHKADWQTYMLVTSAMINLDFIMDERARELAGEMNRWQDLVRPGPDYFVARVQRGNFEAAPNVRTFHALRPIPQQQIQGVTGTPYPQNPGY